MNRTFLALISLLFICFIGFASAENRIFAGEFNDSYLEITPITPAHWSVGSYEEGNSEFYVSFYPSNTRYSVDESHIYSENGYAYFYFIADVPEDTQRIKFYNEGRILQELSTQGTIELSDFNITYNESGFVDFSWNTNLERYYASADYNDSGSWNSLFFEFPLDNVYNFQISLDSISSGYHKFKLIISDGFNEKENYVWFNIPYIGWCNNTDFNHDNVVDASDYITLKNNFGYYNATNSMGDVDLDGYVGWGDLQLFQQNAGGRNCSQAIFPEVNLSLYEEEISLNSLEVSNLPSSESTKNSGNSKISGNTIVRNNVNANSNSGMAANAVNEKNLAILNQPKEKQDFLSRAIGILKKVVDFLFLRK